MRVAVLRGRFGRDFLLMVFQPFQINRGKPAHAEVKVTEVPAGVETTVHVILMHVKALGVVSSLVSRVSGYESADLGNGWSCTLEMFPALGPED